MAECLACEAEIESGDVEIGEIIVCSECGADMEVVAVHPLELELIEDDEDEEDEDESDEDDADDEEDEEFSG